MALVRLIRLILGFCVLTLLVSGCSGSALKPSSTQSVALPSILHSSFYTTQNSSSSSLSLIAADTSTSGLSFSVDTSGTQGTVTLSGATAVYTPSSNFNGIDSFNFIISNGSSQVSTTVKMNVMAPYTWTGSAGDGLWNNPANWCGSVKADMSGCQGASTVPGSSDTVVFDKTCTSNCNATINTSINIKGLIMESQYSGTLTQGTGNSITIGSDGWTQSSGTFTGSNANITLNDSTFTLSGGTFTAPTATMTIFPPDDGITTTVTFLTIGDSAVFNPNGGTFDLEASAGVPGSCANYNLVLDAPNGQNFSNFTETSSGSNYCADTYLQLNSGSSINVLGNFTHGGTYMHLDQGTFDVYGNFINSNTSAYGNNAVVEMVGSANQTYTGNNDTSYPTVKLIVNKSGGSLTATNSNIMAVQSLVLTQGSINMAGYPLWVKSSLTMASGTSITESGGTLTVSGSTVSAGVYGSGTINP